MVHEQQVIVKTVPYRQGQDHQAVGVQDIVALSEKSRRRFDMFDDTVGKNGIVPFGTVDTFKTHAAHIGAFRCFGSGQGPRLDAVFSRNIELFE